MRKTLIILTVTGILLTGLTIIAGPQKADGGMYILPLGGQVLWPNSSKIPEGFIAEAPGKEVSTNQYPDLYNLIGDNYGTPKEPGDFVLPYNPVPRQSNFSSLETLDYDRIYRAPQDMFVFSYVTGPQHSGGVKVNMGVTPEDMKTVSENGNGCLNKCGGAVMCPIPAGYCFSVSCVGPYAVKQSVFDIQLGTPKPVQSIDDFVNNSDSNSAAQCWIIKAM